ncbi:chloride channel protein [Ideonella livida]|uniref:chloride channel protein n=1 Tax=Ideonella livida TaxID=2707176 RepID=UPI002872D6F2|nr:chloride channel protein [Ideonella livida]
MEPAFWAQLQQEAVAWRPWADRAVVLGAALLTGAAVVTFTLLAEAAGHAAQALSNATPLGPWVMLAWTPLLTVGLLGWTRRWAPTAAGSGIPQVLSALDEHTPGWRRAQLVGWSVALHKIGLVCGGLLAGLSMGREGPTVQVGAGLMVQARRWLSDRTTLDAHDLMVAGAAAGVAAAFNTPLGGIVFALEQLTRRRHLTHSSLVIAAIVLAGLVAVAVFGQDSYFGHLGTTVWPAGLWWPALLTALACGLAGGLFARLLVLSARPLGGRLGRWRQHHPYRFAAVCGLAVAVIGAVSDGATAGASYQTTRQLLEGGADTPLLYTLLKSCATWLSAWAGVPGGVFAPSLAIGAGIGHDMAQWWALPQASAVVLVALGMAGFLAASTGGPITAFIIVMEMVGGQSQVLGLMACALLATGVSRLISRPLYLELAVGWSVTPSGSLSDPGPDGGAPVARSPAALPPGQHGRPAMSLIDDLTRLDQLHREGALSDDEFRQAKARLLDVPLGAQVQAPSLVQGVNRLRRSVADRWLGGVCGGLAQSTGIEAWVWRLGVVVLALFGGSGLLAYALLWLFVPSE